MTRLVELPKSKLQNPQNEYPCSYHNNIKVVKKEQFELGITSGLH